MKRESIDNAKHDWCFTWFVYLFDFFPLLPSLLRFIPSVYYSYIDVWVIRILLTSVVFYSLEKYHRNEWDNLSRCAFFTAYINSTSSSTFISCSYLSYYPNFTISCKSMVPTKIRISTSHNHHWIRSRGFFFYLVSWCDRRKNPWWISWSPQNTSTTTGWYRTFNSQRIRSRFSSQSPHNEFSLFIWSSLILDQFTWWTKYNSLRCLRQW